MYAAPNRRYAQMSPSEQYTLVSMSGRNSMPAPLGSGFPTWSGGAVFPEGKNVTNACRGTKPMRYNFSRRSTTKVILDEGGLRFAHDQSKFGSYGRIDILVDPPAHAFEGNKSPDKSVTDFDWGFCNGGLSNASRRTR